MAETTRILNPPRTVDPYYHQAEQFAGINARLSLLERPASNGIVFTPTGLSNFTFPVPDGVSLVSLEYEYLSSAVTTLTVQPNGNASNLTNDEHFTSSTLSPLAITEPSQQVARPGVPLGWSAGAAGAMSAVGRATFQVIPRTGGRRVARSDFTVTNTVGSGNFYQYVGAVGAVIDANIGATAQISSLKVVSSSGTFSGHFHVAYM
jgi:hypothetical protein